jgi:hypothetical protein
MIILYFTNNDDTRHPVSNSTLKSTSYDLNLHGDTLPSSKTPTFSLRFVLLISSLIIGNFPIPGTHSTSILTHNFEPQIVFSCTGNLFTPGTNFTQFSTPKIVFSPSAKVPLIIPSEKPPWLRDKQFQNKTYTMAPPKSNKGKGLPAKRSAIAKSKQPERTPSTKANENSMDTDKASTLFGVINMEIDRLPTSTYDKIDTLVIPKIRHIHHQLADELVALSKTPYSGLFGEGPNFFHDDLRTTTRVVACLNAGGPVDFNKLAKDGLSKDTWLIAFSCLRTNKYNSDRMEEILFEANLEDSEVDKVKVVMSRLSYTSPLKLFGIVTQSKVDYMGFEINLETLQLIETQERQPVAFTTDDASVTTFGEQFGTTGGQQTSNTDQQSAASGSSPSVNVEAAAASGSGGLP